MANLDLARLRELTIGSNVDEEAVTVNTRALIDKVLARYSGDWTTLRELIQNAADAGASKVTIRFETLPSKSVPLPPQADQASLLNHTISHHTLYRLVVSNNGQHFGDSDWSRLKRIAEGNPDETKIGAFGVGFYSVFADCEEPFVISGRKTMAFLWKGNSLFTKSSVIGPEQRAQETSFVLNYRNTTSPIPALLSICKFLTTSLTFVGLENIEFWMDSWKVLQLQKKSSPAVEAQIPAGVNTQTKEKLMKIVSVSNQSTQIDATWMNIVARTNDKTPAQTSKQTEDEPVTSFKSFFSRLATHATQNTAAKRAAREVEAAKDKQISENAHLTSQATAFLRVSTVNIQTSVSKTFAAELERATKKPPPKKTRIAILTSSRDETAASLTSSAGITEQHAEEVFTSVLPNKHGRVFIGFPTAQTTGMLCHISAPSVIPTVERENIDLNARYVKTWNTEMLRVAGIACRVAYAEAFEDLNRSLMARIKAASRASPNATDIESFIPQATHIFNQYTATESTPSSLVGQLIEEAFWDSSKRATVDVLSSRGVLPSSQVRVVLQPLSFVENIPIIPSQLAKNAEEFVRQLYNRGLVTDMTVTDMRKELESQSLAEAQVIEFLKWLAQQASSNALDAGTVQTLLNSAVGAVDEENGKSRLIALSQIKSFLSGSKIPPIMPFPESTIPFKLTKSLSRTELIAFNWEELEVVPWVRWLIETAGLHQLPQEKDLFQSPVFAASVLAVVSKQWDQLSQASKSSLVELLSSRPIMPTKCGMRIPSEAYFASVKIFDDLPIVTLDRQVKDKVLTALGVRKTIELNVVFERLMSKSSDGSDQPKWSFKDLVSYLAGVQRDIPAKDIHRLKTAEICPVEQFDSKAKDPVPDRLLALHQLYVPNEIHRRLGLPVLFWSGHWNPHNSEARFLDSLGLRPHPPITEVIEIMLRAAKQRNIELYGTAMGYFLENYEKNGYSSAPKANFTAAAFLPVEGKDFPMLYAPKACFSNPMASVLGYPILQAHLRPHAFKFGVQQDPPMASCVETLIGNPPTNRHEAIEAFNYFASRLGDINKQLSERLGSANIVPISARSEKRATRSISPKMCFLGDPTVYGDILDFVDFDQAANSFLLKVGAKNEPTSIELARMVQDDPYRVLELLREERYLQLLRRLAENHQALKHDKQLWKELKAAPFLIAYREITEDSKRSSTRGKELINLDENDDEKTVRELSLRRPSEIVVEDSYREYSIFKTHLYVAPQDQVLESFYMSLGVPNLQSILQLDERVGNIQRNQGGGMALRKLIVERSRLFIHEYSQEVKHDSKWLEKNLNVIVADSLSLTTSLKGYRVASHRENKSAIISQDRKGATLYIINQPDLYEVSRCIVPLLLSRPRRHDVLALEMVMTTDLRRLRHKGYNVDRILRQQEFETRMAQEESRKAEVELDKQVAERVKAEKSREKSQPSSSPLAIAPPPSYDDATENHQEIPSMPGSFEPDSPPRPPKGHRNLLSNMQDWGKQLGSKIRNIPVEGPSQNQNMLSEPIDGGKITEPTPPIDAAATDRNVSNSLANAIKSSRSFTSNSLWTPPKSTIVEQAKSGSYCDATPATDLTMSGTAANGIKFFRSQTMTAEQQQLFQARSGPGIEKFSVLLAELASIFGMPLQNLHMYWDPRSASIAFNTDGALFFNLHYFDSLHLAHFETSRDKKIDAVAYWWVTLCHELAHNLVEEHSAAHSFYTESFASQYFAKAMQKALQY